MRIIQAVHIFDYGDGVGNDIIKKEEIFQELGYQTVICAYDIHPKLRERAQYFKDIDFAPDDILLHHYSGGCILTESVAKLNCKKVMIYHNITPPEFVDGDTRNFCISGLNQLKTLKGRYDFYAGDSQFNVDCLKELGVADAGDVIPIVVEFPDSEDSERIAHQEKIFLFVGRVAQNKKLEDIIEIFNYYFCNINAHSRLLLPGNLNVSNDYTQRLRDQIASLPSRGNIELMGKVSDEELRSLYLKADIYISMSEHEGFGIPLLEAMNYRIPVLAYNAAAVKDTMGGSGILVDTKDPEMVAKICEVILSNQHIREEIAAKQALNLKRYSAGSVKARIEELLMKWRGIVMIQTDDRIIDSEELLRKIRTKVLNKGLETNSLSTDAGHDHALIISRIRKDMLILDQTWSIHDSEIKAGFVRRSIKRLIRKTVYWLIRPYWDQQIAHNAAATRIMGDMLKLLEDMTK